MMYKMKLGEVLPSVVPTVGFNIEKIKINKLEILIFDVGYRPMFRSTW